MRRFFVGGLRGRLVLILLVAIIPSIGLTVYNASRERQREIREAQEDVSQEAKIIAVEEERLVDETRELLIAISHLDDARRPDPATCDRYFAHLLQHFRRYSNFGVVDRKGNVLCSAVPLPGPVNVADREYFQRAVATKGFAVGDFQIGRITKRPGINLAYPVLGEGGQLYGVVYAVLDLSELGRLEKEIASGLHDGVTITKIDRSGVVLSRQPGGTDEVGGRFPGFSRIEPLLGKGRGTVQLEKGAGGETLLFAVAEVPRVLPKRSMYVVLSVPTMEVFREVHGVFFRNMTTLVFVVLLVLGAAWAGSSVLVLNPVRNLLQATKRLEEGDLDARSGPPYPKGELGKLSLGFDRMATALAARREERDRAEQALRRSEEEYRNIVNHSPLGVFRSTPDGTFLMVNPALVKMLGYGSAAELMEMDIAGRIYRNPGDRQRVLAEYMAQETVIGIETVWKRKDGTPLDVRAGGRLVRNPDGSPSYFEVFVEDQTERKRLEKQYLHAQRLEAVGRLAGGVAHDFNNLLGVILGYSDLLMSRMEPGTPFAGKIEGIRKAADRASGLTRQFLAFSRKQVLEPKVLDLNEIVVDTEKMLRRLISEDIELTLRLAEHMERVKIDPGQLEQVIMNLVVNARDAMSQGGKIFIETAVSELPEARLREGITMPAGRYVMLSVSDTGHGMDEETRSRIFEPFFTTKEHGKGTGLGLSTVYGIVKQSGGYIWVYSEPGRGTTFKIYLAAVSENADRAKGRKISPPAAGGQETVLVVEDDASLRQLFCEYLENAGYTPFTAVDPADAIRIAKSHPEAIDLMVTDVVMPGISGKNLSERMALLKPGMKVLYVSGYTDNVIADHGILREGTFFLAKPFGRDVFLRKVREVLDSGTDSPRS